MNCSEGTAFSPPPGLSARELQGPADQLGAVVLHVSSWVARSGSRGKTENEQMYLHTCSFIEGQMRYGCVHKLGGFMGHGMLYRDNVMGRARILT